MTLVQKPSTTARAWHAVIAVGVLFAVIVQLTLVIRGVNVLVEEGGRVAGVGERILRFFSYFTVQSNLLCLVTSAGLAIRPARDGRLWRVARLDALVGITVTIIVFILFLAPLLDLSGLAWLTNLIFHYLVPIAMVLGWLLFGPRPRVDTRTLLLSLIWPVAYIVYVGILGAITGWYPYPFTDVGQLGYATVLRNGVLVVVLILVVGAIYKVLDGRLPRRER